MTFNTAAWLASVLGHINEHPHLNGTVSTVYGDELRLQIGGIGTARDSNLDLYAAWLRSMDAVLPIEVTCVPIGELEYTHLHAHGPLADGIEIEIGVCLGAAESDLLAANTRVEVGARFPVNLLNQLVDHRMAEAVTRG